MKIFVSADIEGVAGVVVPAHGEPGNLEYERARRLMTGEVNAAIAGAFDGGASLVLVNDGHGPMLNILPEELDQRAELILGKPKPANMCAGLDGSFAAVFFTGYHSGAGRNGVLSHSVNGFAFNRIMLNGHDCAEATLYGAYAGSMGVPVALLTGDDQLMEQCAPLFPGIQQAQVKHALSQRAAQAFSPSRACATIRQAAEAAVRGLNACAPFVIPGPYRLEFDLASVAMADQASIIPVAIRTGPRGVAFDAMTMPEVIGWVNTLSALSAALR